MYKEYFIIVNIDLWLFIDFYQFLNKINYNLKVINERYKIFNN